MAVRAHDVGGSPCLQRGWEPRGAVQDVVHALRTFDDYEVIVVNDGSSDGTGEVADRLAATIDRVRAIHHEQNRGFSASYQTGLQHARMAYFTFLPGDHEVARRVGRRDLRRGRHGGSGHPVPRDALEP